MYTYLKFNITIIINKLNPYCNFKIKKMRHWTALNKTALFSSVVDTLTMIEKRDVKKISYQNFFQKTARFNCFSPSIIWFIQDIKRAYFRL